MTLTEVVFGLTCAFCGLIVSLILRSYFESSTLSRVFQSRVFWFFGGCLIILVPACFMVSVSISGLFYKYQFLIAALLALIGAGVAFIATRVEVGERRLLDSRERLQRRIEQSPSILDHIIGLGSAARVIRGNVAQLPMSSTNWGATNTNLGPHLKILELTAGDKKQVHTVVKLNMHTRRGAALLSTMQAVSNLNQFNSAVATLIVDCDEIARLCAEWNKSYAERVRTWTDRYLRIIDRLDELDAE